MIAVATNETSVDYLGTSRYSDAEDLVTFHVDGDIYRYLIDRAMLSEAPSRSRSTGKTWLNYVKKCPGRCKKNGVEINHLGSLENNNDEVSNERV